MIFIPLLYATQTAVLRKEKWVQLKKHLSHAGYAVAGGIIGILPQLLYWKRVTGSWIYDVGSKWDFLDPHWQVLFGWEKGWFIYTPVTILMVIGLWFIRKHSFYRSVLIFFILNTWVVIAWSDWQYGASYSTRALVQSYALLAIPLAALIQHYISSKWKYALIVLSCFLISLNLFQIWQYNTGLLHYRDMNRKYYGAIFLNPNPTPLQMSLLDTDEILRNENGYKKIYEWNSNEEFILHAGKLDSIMFYQVHPDEISGYTPVSDRWIFVEAEVSSDWGAFDSDIIVQYRLDQFVKERSIRLQNGISRNATWNHVEFYFQIPSGYPSSALHIFAKTNSDQDIRIRDIRIRFLKAIL